MKIGPKIVDCIFIGYAHNNTAYQFIVHDSNISDVNKNTIMASGNASFFEYFHVNSRRSQVHQNVSCRLLMKIVKIKMKIVSLSLNTVKEQG